jgi:hypothetical protein
MCTGWGEPIFSAYLRFSEEMQMEWTVSVSASELAAGALNSETEGMVHAAFSEHGCVLLRGAFPGATIDAMHREFEAQFGSMDLAAMQGRSRKLAPSWFRQVSDARFEITPKMTGAFGAPSVFANSLLLKLISPWLGGEVRLIGLSAVMSYPGASEQHPHRDHPHLFPDGGSTSPIYAVAAMLPLVDIDLESGPTAFWLGSHRWAEESMALHGAPTVCPLQRGDCMLVDYRTVHAVLPNRSGRQCPIVYLAYARPWFFDYGNDVRRIPLDMPIERYNELPASLHPLLTRALSYATFARWREVDVPARARTPGA